MKKDNRANPCWSVHAYTRGLENKQINQLDRRDSK